MVEIKGDSKDVIDMWVIEEGERVLGPIIMGECEEKSVIGIMLCKNMGPLKGQGDQAMGGRHVHWYVKA